MQRVVITGCGTINPLGNNVLETWDSMQEGKNGIKYLNISGIDRLSTKFGAQIKVEDSTLEKVLGKKPDNFDRATLFALLASKEAINSSGINFSETLERF